MRRTDIERAIRQHTQWRRQFLNAFAGGNYADMPLSEHRGCTLATLLNEAGNTGELQELAANHRCFHALADDIIELSNSGLGDSADLLLPELNEASYQLLAALDILRDGSD